MRSIYLGPYFIRVLPEKTSTQIMLSRVIISDRAAKWGDSRGVVEDRASQPRLPRLVSQLRYFKGCVTLDMSMSVSVPQSLHLQDGHNNANNACDNILI